MDRRAIQSDDDVDEIQVDPTFDTVNYFYYYWCVAAQYSGRTRRLIARKSSPPIALC